MFDNRRVAVDLELQISSLEASELMIDGTQTELNIVVTEDEKHSGHAHGQWNDNVHAQDAVFHACFTKNGSASKTGSIIMNAKRIDIDSHPNPTGNYGA